MPLRLSPPVGGSVPRVEFPLAGPASGGPALVQPEPPLQPVPPVRRRWSALPPGWRLPPALDGLLRGLRPSVGSPNAARTPLAQALGLASQPEVLGALAKVFGPALPADTTFAPVATANPALNGLVFQTNYDEANDGRFSVPGAAGTISMEAVLAQPDPAAFIERHLSYGAKGLPGVLCVFVPGLNTPEPESERRLQQQYSPVLGDRRMAHLHLGSDTDQGDVEFEVAPALVEVLRAPALVAAGLAPQLRREGDVTFARLDAGQRDRAEAVLVAAGLIETQLMTAVKDLLVARLEGPGGPQKLDLLLYSRGSIDGAAAIAGWIADYTQRRTPALGAAQARAEAQRLLAENVLVETYGNASRQFPDGPSYIHWSAYNDPLTKDVGSTAAHPSGGGKNALYMHYDGIFKGFDAHNLGAVGAAAAQLSLELNGVPNSRALYEAHRAGTPVVLPTSAQVQARVAETGGANWLWNPAVALGNG